MNSRLSPEEKARIAEEQRIRKNASLKYSLKLMGKTYLIGGSIFLLAFCCMCMFVAMASNTILKYFSY